MTGGYDLKPYTSKAKKAIDLAARISKKMNYSYVGTEHILAGLIKEGTGVAAEVLTACNVEYDKLISMIEDLISPGDNIEVMDRDGYSPRTQRVLERASEEADRFECNEIGTEHLLMAIVLQGDCAAARLLNTMGVNSQKMFIDILGAMGEDPSAYRDLMKSYGTSYNSATPVLDQYSRDLTDMAEAGLLDPVIGRKRRWSTLSRYFAVVAKQSMSDWRAGSGQDRYSRRTCAGYSQWQCSGYSFGKETGFP